MSKCNGRFLLDQMSLHEALVPIQDIFFFRYIGGTWKSTSHQIIHIHRLTHERRICSSQIPAQKDNSSLSAGISNLPIRSFDLCVIKTSRYQEEQVESDRFFLRMEKYWLDRWVTGDRRQQVKIKKSRLCIDQSLKISWISQLGSRLWRLFCMVLVLVVYRWSQGLNSSLHDWLWALI